MDHCALYILSCETKDFKIIRLYVNFILVNPCIPTIRPFLSDDYTPVFLILNLRYNTPNVMLGKQEYSCHQGKYFSENKKKNYIEQRNRPKKSDIFAKSRKHTKPTKKMDCPVKFCVKKIFRFTLYKIISDSKHNHSKK